MPHVFARVRDGAQPEAIATYLVELEQKSMGLEGDPANARAAVDLLLDWREWIWEHLP